MNEQNPLQPNEPIKDSHNIWIAIIAVVSASLIVGGSVYIWQNSKIKSTEQNLQQQIVQMETQTKETQQLQQQIIQLQTHIEQLQSSQKQTPSDVSTIQPPDETENWIKYSDEKHGFEFKHPSDVKIKDVSQNVGAIDDEMFYNGLRLTKDKLKLHLSIANTEDANNFYHGGAPTKQISESTKKLGDLDVKKTVVLGYQVLPDGTWVLTYKFNDQNDAYIFSTHEDGTEEINPIPKSTEDLMEQILSTFKFTK